MCLTPIKIKNNGPKTVQNQGFAHHLVPCGKCPKCRAKRVNSWAFRLARESNRHSILQFATLTYDPQYVPISAAGYMSLRKSDLQNFFKRLRKKINDGRIIKYYAAGEYGSRTARPHYHLIIFGATEKEIQEGWQLGGQYIGSVHCGTLTPASVKYTLKYVNKPSRIPMHEKDDRVPEFSLMSKRLGDNYITDSVVKWHKQDLKNYVVLEGGVKSHLPRYYKEKIFNDDEKKLIANAATKQHNDIFLQSLEEFNGDEYELFKVRHERVRAMFRVHNDASKLRDKI